MGVTVSCPSSTCTFVVTPYQATPEDYEAVAIVWGVTLGAACVIWGLKQLFRIFRERPEA